MNDEIEQQLIVVMVVMLSECWRYESGSLWCVPLAVLPALVVLAVRVLRRRKKKSRISKKKGSSTPAQTQSRLLSHKIFDGLRSTCKSVFRDPLSSGV